MNEAFIVRPPAEITDWLTTEQMRQWAEDAPDEASRKRRMAIWLTHSERMHAHEVAQALGASVQAVWLWISRYNEHGPEGLLRKARGGRRWGFMSPEKEARVLKPFLVEAKAGTPRAPAEIRGVIEKHLKRDVSMSYVYRLLRRHGWAEILAQSHQRGASRRDADTFDALVKPWVRTDGKA